MKSKGTDRPHGRLMTPDEMRQFEEDILPGRSDADEPVADETQDRESAGPDRLTKSGRLKIEDIEAAESTGPDLDKR